MTGRFSQVYVSGLDEVDRVMILNGMNMYIVYVLNYYILLYIIIYNNSIIQVLNNHKTLNCVRAFPRHGIAQVVHLALLMAYGRPSCRI